MYQEFDLQQLSSAQIDVMIAKLREEKETRNLHRLLLAGETINPGQDSSTRYIAAFRNAKIRMTSTSTRWRLD